MGIVIGNETIIINLESGVYPATIKSIKRTENVTLKAGASLPAVIIEFELEISGKYLTKDRKYIVTDRKGSELRTLLEELTSEADFEAVVDLNNLIGEKCKVTIVENISKNGNRFQNIGTVTAMEVTDLDG